MKVTYEAPGKIILSGEHSVVYTKPALVTAINLQIRCTLEETSLKNNEINKDIRTNVEVIEKIVLDYLSSNNIDFKKKFFKISLESDIPVGLGMGSSAAFCVAVVTAMLHFFTGSSAQKEIINSLAYKGDKLFHGNPSGVDVSASCYGGLIYFRKEFEFLKNISALHMKIPKVIEENLILINTGKPKETTADMVSLVKKRYNDNPKKMKKILFEMEKITKKMVISIAKEDKVMFSECIFQNQEYLKKIGVSSFKTNNLLKKLLPFGVGKITGAGGFMKDSGLILFYIKNKKAFETASRKLKLKTTPFATQTQGVVLVI